MTATGITSGHVTLADWLFLIGAVVAALTAVVAYATTGTGTVAKLLAAGLPAALALGLVGWLVL